ncbi:hypothetical protein J0H58_15710 [bacterium]|nr:hypothetical protein [bacterium]
MNLNVIIVPHESGFRAWTGGLLDLTADGPTPDAAAEALRALVIARLPKFEVRTIHVPDPLPVAERVSDPQRDADFEAFREAVEEYRRIHNTVPDDE